MQPDNQQQAALPIEVHPAEAAWYSTIRAGATWHEVAERAMRELVGRGLPFSADDLRDLLGKKWVPPTPNAIGGLFIAWSRQGLIVRVGGGTSRAVKRRGGHRHVWIGAGRAQRLAA